MTNLNELAVAAITEESAMWEIKAHYMPLIERLTAENWYKMNNEVHFMDDCFRRIEYAVRKFDPTRGSLDSRVRYLLQQGIRHYCKNRGGKRKELDSLEGLYERQTRETSSVNIGNVHKALIEPKTPYSAEDMALDNIEEAELTAEHAENETDKLILDVIFNSKDALSQSEITRKLAEKTGRSFDSARGAVRSFIKRKKEQVTCDAA